MRLALTKPLSRRTTLRELGAVVGLPLLEAMNPAIAGVRELQRPPVRSALVFMPNGVIPEEWTPKGNGSSFQMSPMLKPFDDLGLKDDLLLLEGLWNENSEGRNGHWPKVPAWLSRGFVERGTGPLNAGGASVDQVMPNTSANEQPSPR